MNVPSSSYWTVEAVNAEGQRIILEQARLEEVTVYEDPWYGRNHFTFSAHSYEVHVPPTPEPTFRDVIKKMYPAGGLQ